MRSVRRLGFYLLLAAAVSCSSHSSSSGPPSLERLYRLDGVGALSIRLDAEKLEKLKKKPRKFVRGTVSYGGKTYEDVAIRLKGHRSMRPLGKKSAFKLRFDKYVEGRTFDGSRDVVLNNMVEDETMMREYLGYRFYRAAGVPAPNVGYVEVTVNGELYGLYALIESIDAAFLESRFGDSSGNLFEGEYGCDLYSDDVEGFDLDHGDGDRSELARLASTVPKGPAALFYDSGHPIDTDKFLSYLAVSAFIADFDGYRHAHNYRIYRSATQQRWSFIPWGIDRAFKKKKMDIYDSEGLLATICFADARCRLDYLRKLLSITAEFERLDFQSGVKVLDAITVDAIVRDPKRPYETKQVLRARKKLVEFVQERPQKVRDSISCIGESGEIDGDGDGYGCVDCDDDDPKRHPGAAEICDSVDNDCNGLVDDAAGCGCPELAIDGAVFLLCDLPMPWHRADAYCKELGGALARVDNKAQNKKLYAAAMERSKVRWWIGLNDRREEGTFVWADSAPAGYTNWNKGEPDNDACNQDCACLKEDSKNARWHDTHCGAHRPFICRAGPESYGARSTEPKPSGARP